MQILLEFEMLTRGQNCGTASGTQLGLGEGGKASQHIHTRYCTLHHTQHLC